MEAAGPSTQVERQGSSRELAKCLEEESLEERQSSLGTATLTAAQRHLDLLYSLRAFFHTQPHWLPSTVTRLTLTQVLTSEWVYGEALLPCDIPFMLAHTGK